jgi:hypothetical protein
MSLDRHLTMLRYCGIGVGRSAADIITPEMEQKLWYLGILGNEYSSIPVKCCTLLQWEFFRTQSGERAG